MKELTLYTKCNQEIQVSPKVMSSPLKGVRRRVKGAYLSNFGNNALTKFLRLKTNADGLTQKERYRHDYNYVYKQGLTVCVFPRIVHWEGLETVILSVAMSTPSAQILVSKDYSPIKGTKTLQKWLVLGLRQVLQDESAEPCVA